MSSIFTVQNRNHGITTGYWGEPDSLHQFCEPHYQTSYYFAEFYNSLSSLIYPLVAAYALCSCRAMRADVVIASSWAWVALIGLGSFAFHGTMRYAFQLCDELPMIGFVHAALLAKVSSPGMHPRITTRYQSRVWSAGVTLLCAGFVVAYLILDSYDLFVNGFTALVLLDTAVGFTCRMHQPITKYCAKACLVCVVIAKSAWEIENRFCRVSPNVWPLHCVWHVLSCLAVYYGIVTNFSMRVDGGVWSENNRNNRKSSHHDIDNKQQQQQQGSENVVDGHYDENDKICMKWAVLLPFDEIRCGTPRKMTKGS